MKKQISEKIMNKQIETHAFIMKQLGGQLSLPIHHQKDQGVSPANYK